MSGSSPSDLAVAFRSIPRRLTEALGPVDGDRESASDELGAVEALLAQVATILGTSAEPSAIADELHERPADAWDVDVLERLRALALRIGPLMRAVTEQAERVADRR